MNTRGKLGRRGFLARAAALEAVAPVAGGLLAACYEADKTAAPGTQTSVTGPASTGTTAPETPTSTATTEHSTPTATPQPAEMTADEMDAMNEARVKAFLDNIGKTRGFPEDATFTTDGNVKVFQFTVDDVRWETEAGVVKAAIGYNSLLPGPTIRVTLGDRVRISFRNNLKESTGVHWHGIDTPNDQDGVPFVTQPPIKPGQTYTYEFEATPAGTHMYHSHHNATDQVGRGLLGAFIVEAKDRSRYPHYDHEYVMVLNDGYNGFTINGKSFPATQPLTAKVGETLLIRYLNEGLAYHPMHLHGMPQQVYAVDGYPLPQPYLTDTVSVAPGNRYEVLVKARARGLWAFHCHVLSHVERPEGMFGLVTVLAIE